MSGRCPICTEIFDPSEIAAGKKCGHTFHLGCVSNWLHKSSSCPVCRESMAITDVITQLFFDYGEDTGSIGGGVSTPEESAKRVSELSKKVQFLESELTKATKLVKDGQGKTDALEKEARAEQEKVAGLEKKVEKLETDMGKASKLAKDNQQKVDTLEMKVQNLQAERATATELAKEQQKKTAALEKKVIDLQRRKSLLEREIGDKTMANTQLEKKNLMLETTVQKLLSQLASLENVKLQKDELVRQNQQLQAEMKKLQGDLVKANGDAVGREATLMQENEDLKKQNMELQKQLNAGNSDLSESIAEVIRQARVFSNASANVDGTPDNIVEVAEVPCAPKKANKKPKVMANK